MAVMMAFGAAAQDTVVYQGCKLVVSMNCDSLTIIGGVPSADSSLYIPTSLIVNGVRRPVSEVGPQAFRGNQELAHLYIDTITRTKISAFWSCSNLRSVVTKDIKEIGEHTFKSCNYLKNWALNCPPPRMKNNTVVTAYSIKVDIPCEYKELYLAADIWNVAQFFIYPECDTTGDDPGEDTTVVGIAAPTAELATPYPNPTRGLLHLQQLAATVEIDAIDGRRLWSGRNVAEVDLSQLPAGLYVVRADGKAYRILKQ